MNLIDRAINWLDEKETRDCVVDNLLAAKQSGVQFAVYTSLRFAMAEFELGQQIRDACKEEGLLGVELTLERELDSYCSKMLAILEDRDWSSYVERRDEGWSGLTPDDDPGHPPLDSRRHLLAA